MLVQTSISRHTGCNARSFRAIGGARLPFLEDGEIDNTKLAAHVRWCLDSGCSSVTLFGSTGEGGSIGLSERQRTFDSLMAAGIEPSKIVGGAAASSIEDCAAQMGVFLDKGCRAVLCGAAILRQDAVRKRCDRMVFPVFSTHSATRRGTSFCTISRR